MSKIVNALLLLTVILSSCIIVPVEHPQTTTLIEKLSAHNLFSQTIRFKVGLLVSPGANSVGTGTVVSEVKTDSGWEYVVITAAHVMNMPGGTSTIRVEVDRRDRDGWIVETVSTDITSSHVLRASDLYDIAVIKFLTTARLPVTTARIANFKEMADATPGSQIYAVGCSFGHPALIHVGTISSKIRDPRAPISSWIVASINWDGGSSGGGVYNTDLGLIGVISAEQGSGVGTYVPLSTPFFDEDGATTFLEVLQSMLGLSLSPLKVEPKHNEPTKL